MGTLGGADSFAQSINNLGQVAGTSYLAGDIVQHAFVTAPNSAINPATDDLGVLPGSTSSQAIAINNHGVVLGVSGHPFVWTSQAGMKDLTSMLGSSGTGWTVSNVRGLNNAGQIVGTAINASGQIRAIVLTPNISLNSTVAPPKPTATPAIASFPSPSSLYRDLPQFMNTHGGELSKPSTDFINAKAVDIAPLIDPTSGRFMKDFTDALGDNLSNVGFASTLAANLYAGYTLDPAARTKSLSE